MGENDNNRGNNNGGGKQPRNRQTLLVLAIATLVTLLMISYMHNAINEGTNKKISYDEFIEKVEKGEVEKVVIDSDEIEITPKDQSDKRIKNTFITARVEDEGLTDRLLKAGVKFEQKETSSADYIIAIILTYVLPLVAVWILLSFLMRRMS
nr:ATP-dependent metallopeptidase FtsH/Yme1/Tma family protein [Lachnospiraceae bacterium]